MKILNIILPALILLMLAGSAGAETLKAIVIDGNTLFNDTIDSANRPYEKFYAEKELAVAKTDAERGSKLFLLTKDGTLYYPAPKKGATSTIFLNQNMNAPRIIRIFGKELQAQINAQNKKKFSWLTLVHVVGHEVELTGDIYPGYSGVKGIYIKTIKCDEVQ